MALFGCDVFLCFCAAFFFLNNLIQKTDAITLSPCGNDRTAEVIQGWRNNTFTCSGLKSNTQVQWMLTYNNITNGAGRCLPDGGNCSQGILGSVATPSRLSKKAVQIVLDPTRLLDEDVMRLGTLTCAQGQSTDSCRIDYIVPARGNCSVEAGRESSRFELDGNCTMESGAQSSRNRYSCEWRNSATPTWQVKVPLTSNNYQTGCALRGQSLPNATGQFNYTVTLLPGRTAVAAGSLNITRPTVPTESGCGGEDYIPENTAVTCTCNTDTIGLPQGRLLWIEVGNNSNIQAGDYGNDTLTVSQTLQRNDHQSTQFRCAVDWTDTVLGPSFKFNVGYAPTDVSLYLNQSETDLTVNEHETVNFTCHSDGRPASNLTLVKRDNSSILSSGLSPLGQEAVGRCEDSGHYQCTADNGMGSAVTGASLKLLVTCSPRGVYDVGEVTFIDQPVSLIFDVMAVPMPDQVTFSYLDNESKARDVNLTQIQLTGVCASKSGSVYRSTCIVVVTAMTSQSAAGLYEVTVTNPGGSGQFRFRVLYQEASTTSEVPQVSETSVGAAIAESDPSPYFGVAIGACVVLSVLIFVIVGVIIWMWRRHWKLPWSGTPATAAASNPLSQPETPGPDESDHYYLEPQPKRSDTPVAAVSNPQPHVPQPGTSDSESSPIYTDLLPQPDDFEGIYSNFEMTEMDQDSLHS